MYMIFQKKEACLYPCRFQLVRPTTSVVSHAGSAHQRQSTTFSLQLEGVEVEHLAAMDYRTIHAQRNVVAVVFNPVHHPLVSTHFEVNQTGPRFLFFYVMLNKQLFSRFPGIVNKKFIVLKLQDKDSKSFSRKIVPSLCLEVLAARPFTARYHRQKDEETLFNIKNFLVFSFLCLFTFLLLLLLLLLLLCVCVCACICVHACICIYVCSNRSSTIFWYPTGYQCCGANRFYRSMDSICCYGNKQPGASFKYSCCQRTSFDPALYSGGGGQVLCCHQGNNSRPFNNEKQVKLASTWKKQNTRRSELQVQLV